ncbi:MAG: hypothetical protein AAF658_06400, partial [Myxococcota bacterium]
AAYRLYCGKDLTDAHSAEADAVAAADVLLAQVERYADLPETVDALDAFCHPTQPNWVDPDGKIVWTDNGAALNFGKHKGKPLAEIARDNPDYLSWICGANFSETVASICRDALEGRFPERNDRAA